MKAHRPITPAKIIRPATVLLSLLVFHCVFAAAPMTKEQSLAETKKTLVIYKQQMQKGDLKGAEASARRMMALAKGREGEQSPGYAICISHLAEVYNAAGKIVETAQCFEKALEIQRKHGPGTRHIATIMNNLGYCYLDLGATEKAVPLFKESVEITTKLYGKNHIDTVNRMHALARAYLRAGKFADAELLLKETLSLVEKDLGKKHDLYASILSDYAQLYAMKKEYGKAKTICMEAVALRKEINGELHPKTLQILTNMGILMRCAGDYKGAENLYLEQLQKLGSRKEPVYQTIRAGILQGLGNIYTLTGNYDKAEPRFKESLKIYIGLYGEGFSSVLDVYLSLIPLYREMGRYDDALAITGAVGQVILRTRGENHPLMATVYDNLGVTYGMMSRTDEEIKMYEKSLSIKQKVYGPDDPALASCLHNLAVAYGARKDYQRALPLEKKALEATRKVYGDEHYNTANVMSDLAYAYYQLHDRKTARPLYEKALALLEKQVGENHPDTSVTLLQMAMLESYDGKNQEAFELMQRVQAITERRAEQVLGFASERNSITFMGTIQEKRDAFLCLVANYFKDDAAARNAAATAVLRSKGTALEALGYNRDAALFSGDPALKEKYEQLSAARQEMARLTFAGPGKEELESYAARVGLLHGIIENLEAELSRASKTYAGKLKRDHVTAEAVAKTLPAGTALIEFVRPEMKVFPLLKDLGKEQPARYLAFVIRPKSSGGVRLIDLGNADTVDKKVAAFRAVLLSTAPQFDGLTGKHKAPSATVSAVKKACTDLYSIVMKPIERYLPGVKHVIVSPEGPLALVPFEAMMSESGRYLTKRYTISYVTAGRDVLRSVTKKTPSMKSTVIFAFPDYNALPSVRPGAGTIADSALAGRRSGEMRSGAFSPLPGTKIEAERIAAALKPASKQDMEILMGPLATEQRFKTLRAPNILHVATHGFFLPDQSPKGTSRSPLENPLLRSGLAMAGANQWAIAAKTGSSNDGLLTAFEVSSLSLSGTGLVVLSACETGLGDIKRGEGVFGLRRAFLQAGASSVVMSMWVVADQETAVLMESFYRELKKGSGKAVSLQKAQHSMIDRLQSKNGFAHPFFWAAFVVIGDWR